jgi:zinc protease
MQSVRVRLFNQMLNARLGELMQKPNPPFLFGRSSYGGFLGEQDAFTSIAVAKTPGELEGAIKAVVAETERARKFGFTLTELERAKQDALVQMGNALRSATKRGRQTLYASTSKISWKAKQSRVLSMSTIFM